MDLTSKPKSGLLVLQHCRAVLPGAVLDDATIVIERGIIKEVTTGSIGIAEDGAEIVDADGLVIGPGFVDPHSHGDGLTGFFDDPNRVVDSLLQCGTTSVLATLGYPDMLKDGIDAQLRHFSERLNPI